MREFLPAPLVIDPTDQDDCKKIDIKKSITRGNLLQKNKIAKQKKFAHEWQTSGAGGLAPLNAPSKFRDLFCFTHD